MITGAVESVQIRLRTDWRYEGSAFVSIPVTVNVRLKLPDGSLAYVETRVAKRVSWEGAPTRYELTQPDADNPWVQLISDDKLEVCVKFRDVITVDGDVKVKLSRITGYPYRTIGNAKLIRLERWRTSTYEGGRSGRESD